ncbi:Fis family transcriptional regulator [Arthrobacter sp. FW306-2-2C-D06B]|uniref:Fis family transcriptional regulator n=1 Tax=Arthrobacter sp. FW306-2-2C-D06B TaxID=2879618 RepID=UPI001F1FB2E9|nr:Fis family transcriptional regulator [Arthrobacter sp. FW306-2-2C-D06B]UKA57010.1 Fis family transcriptional regulator [Arthrobacter sp. FW306-2-2C-D06B]
MDNLLTNPATGIMATELIPLAAALKTMKRANSGMTWIRQKHVTNFLRNLATAPKISHDTFDELPDSRTREYVRGLLIEHGVLPQRNAFLTRYDGWATQALERVSDPQNLDVIRRYIRWHHQRRMNLMEEVSRGTFLRAKQEVTVAIDLLNWLTGHDIKLPELQQSHLDVWQAEGPTTRRIAERFLKWAIKTKAAPAGLAIIPHRRGTSHRLPKPGQDQALQKVIHTNGLETRDRAAAILILVFGQQAENIARLTWDEVTVTDDLVTIQLGSIQIALPDPLAQPWRELAANPGHELTAAHPNTKWVFRGASPGRHINPGHLTTRLSKLFSTRAARLGTLHELTKLAPVAIIAETLGYSPTTIERHATDSAAAYAKYIAARRS